MMSATTPLQGSLVVFTDLDGTLIDHHSYRAEAAIEALQLLASQSVPVVFCSSKTFSEQRFIQDQLGLAHPLILENGSAIAVPPGYFPKAVLEKNGFQTDASGYEMFRFAHSRLPDITAILRGFEGVKGFGDVSDNELELITGLSGQAIGRARERWFTETLVTPLSTEMAQKMAEQLSEFGFVLSRGGRFYTIQSAKADKGNAVRWLSEIFRDVNRGSLVFAAIGDSPNDISMLASVDQAFLVQRHDGSWTPLDMPEVQKVEGIGPAGFSIAVHLLLGTNAL